jgi:protein-disulfide isomerase
MGKTIELVLTVTMVIAATVLAVNSFSGPAPLPGSVSEQLPEPLWEELWEAGTPLIEGRAGAPRILVLTDLECPFCAAFHEELVDASERKPGGFSARYIPHPLAYHAHADYAARAAYCVARTGSFATFVDAVVANRDSLASFPWEVQAASAGFVGSLEACVESEGARRRVAEGLAFGDRVGLTGTPTIIVEGNRQVGLLSAETLDGMGDRAR